MNSGPNDQPSFERSEDRSVERVFMFVRTSILLAICAGLAFLGWTVHVVDHATNKMFEGTITGELAMPAEGPGEAPQFSPKPSHRLPGSEAASDLPTNSRP